MANKIQSKRGITLKLIEGGEAYVSRAEAKNLLRPFENFEEIILDFKGIKWIGQGFADEAFRVFASHHPEIKITPINCHKNVQFMIERVIGRLPKKLLV